MTTTSAPTDLGFTYRANARGVVEISRNGLGVVTLRGNAAAKFLAKAEGATMEAGLKEKYLRRQDRSIDLCF